MSKYFKVTTWCVHCKHIDPEGPTQVWMRRRADGVEILEFKETTCNGQEDYHVSGGLYRNSPDEDWKWLDDDTDEFIGDCSIGSAENAAAIRKFFKDNPLPEEAIEVDEE